MPGDDPCEVRITAGDLEWLAEHTRTLLADRFVACGQHETTIRSIYRWQGAIEDGTEARVALHTTQRHVPEIIRRTTAAHTNDVPGIIVLPIVDGNPDYLQWVRDETNPVRQRLVDPVTSPGRSPISGPAHVPFTDAPVATVLPLGSWFSCLHTAHRPSPRNPPVEATPTRLR